MHINIFDIIGDFPENCSTSASKNSKPDANEMHFRLTFDLDPTTYPDELPLVSVTASNSMLNRTNAEKFRLFLEEYCNRLTLGMK